MTTRQHAKRLIWPTALALLSVGILVFGTTFSGKPGPHDLLHMGLWATAYFAVAWLVSRSFAMVLDRTAAGRRPYPRLLKDLIAAVVFLGALSLTLSLFAGQGAVGALAGSGLIVAFLGFAIRNVVADTLSGIALSVEAPFRIGDWIDIEMLARGRVIEIGWRTTRILTRDSTYVILPNSQIARQRITNYSAPRPQYRAQVILKLDPALPIEDVRQVILDAVKHARLIQAEPAPDVRVQTYEEDHIAYAVRYWLSRFERDIDCRDEIYRIVDEALRHAGMAPGQRKLAMFYRDPAAPPDGQIPGNSQDRAPSSAA